MPSANTAMRGRGVLLERKRTENMKKSAERSNNKKSCFFGFWTEIKKRKSLLGTLDSLCTRMASIIIRVFVISLTLTLRLTLRIVGLKYNSLGLLVCHLGVIILLGRGREACTNLSHLGLNLAVEREDDIKLDQHATKSERFAVDRHTHFRDLHHIAGLDNLLRSRLDDNVTLVEMIEGELEAGQSLNKSDGL